MRVFIAGGTGVVGRRATAALVGAGHEVVVMSRSASNDALIADLGARPRRCDLFDCRQVADAVAGNEVVVNLATSIPPMNTAFKRKAWAVNDRIRIEGSAHLVDAAIAARCSRFIQESITLPYVDCGSEWIDESVPFAPSRTTRCVLEAEASARRFGEQGGSGVVLRLGGFYAPEASHTQASLAMAAKGWAPVMGPAVAYMSPLHADDAATAVVAALEAPAGTYNVTDDEPLSRADALEIIAAAAGRADLRRLPRWLLTLLGGDTARLLMRSQRVSSARLRAATAWKPRVASMRTGRAEIAQAAARPSRGSSRG